MLKHRVIPCLLLQDGGLVKTVKFKNPSYVGDPLNAIKIFNDKEVDELMVLDIAASKNGHRPNFPLIKEIAGECFMPLTYGGGIQSMDDADKVFSSGVEKICLQTSGLLEPDFITLLSKRYGSQSIVISIDVEKNFFGSYCAISSKNRKKIKGGYIDICNRLVLAGAGEILLNSIDRDGTLSGPDLGLINEISRALDVPLIYVGGISSLADIKNAVEAGANGVGVGSYFIYHGPHKAVLITYPKYSELEYLFK